MHGNARQVIGRRVFVEFARRAGNRVPPFGYAPGNPEHAACLYGLYALIGDEVQLAVLEMTVNVADRLAGSEIRGYSHGAQ